MDIEEDGFCKPSGSLEKRLRLRKNNKERYHDM